MKGLSNSVLAVISLLGTRLSASLSTSLGLRFNLGFSLGLSLSVFMLFSGCDKSPSRSQARGEVKVLIPRQSQPGVYKLSEVTLRDVENLYEFRGKYGRFILSPKRDQNQLIGPTPKTMFLRNEKGVYVPEDIITQQVVSIYAVLQDMFELDRKLGIETKNTWPRTIGVSTHLVDSFHRKIETNAIYQKETDSILFPPHSGKSLEIYLNEGVIAHEYFHSLFYKLVLSELKPKNESNLSLNTKAINPSSESSDQDPQINGSPDKSDKIEPNLAEKEVNIEVAKVINDVYLRSINEGLADYWGWLQTRDSEFIGRSIPEEKERRSLDWKPSDLSAQYLAKDGKFIDILVVEQSLSSYVWSAFKKSNGFKVSEESGEYLVGFSYMIGNVISKNLKEMATSMSRQDGPLVVAQAIIDSLPEFKKDFAEVLPHQKYNPAKLLSQIETKKNLISKGQSQR